MKKICAEVIPKDHICGEKIFQQHWWRTDLLGKKLMMRTGY
jgi:hypothetical protein